MKAADLKALKSSLLNRLELLALQAAGPLSDHDWGCLGYNAQAEWAQLRGFSGPIVIRMGRTVWRIRPSPLALRKVAKNLGRLRYQRFSYWTLEPDMSIDVSDW